MHSTKRIMVVDDEKDIASLVERILTKWGYKVDTFTNPIEALHEFEQTNASLFQTVFMLPSNGRLYMPKSRCHLLGKRFSSS